MHQILHRGIKIQLSRDLPNQAKWATFSPWFQWNRPVSLFKSVFCSPIIILFLQYSPKMLPCSWNMTHTGFDVQYFIPNSLIASFLRSLCSTFVLWKVGGTCRSGERNIKILIDFRKSLGFSLTSSLSQLTEKSSRSVFTMCGEPCKSIKFGLKGTFFLKRDYFRICSKPWLVNLVVWHLKSLLSLKCCKWKITNPKGKNWTF